MGTGGRPSPKFEVGDGPCIRHPNVLRSIVIGCEAKYELTKKSLKLGGIFCCEIEVFGQEKGHIMLYIRFQTVYRQKKTQNRVDD